MNKIRDKRIRRAYFRKKLRFLISVLCILATFVIPVLGVWHYQYYIDHPLALEDIESTGLEAQTSLGSLTLDRLPEKVGELEGATYYLIYKEGCSNEFCILTMQKKEYEKIANTIAEEKTMTIEGPLDCVDEPEVVGFVEDYIRKHNLASTLKGKSTDDYMKHISMNYDSEWSTVSKIIQTSYMFFLVVFLLLCYDIGFGADDIKYFRIANSLMPAGGQYADMINRELSLPSARWYDVAQIYVTENFLITFGSKTLGFYRLEDIIDIHAKMTEQSSMGGMTYFYEMIFTYRDGRVYETTELLLSFLQPQKRMDYEAQLEEIVQAVSAKNENAQIHKL